MDHDYSTDHLSPEAKGYFLAYGRCIIAWNCAERQVKYLLSSLIGKEFRSDLGNILSAELGSRTLLFALKSIAHDLLDGDPASEVAYAAQLFEQVLGHRNYIVHGPVSHSDHVGGGLVHGWTAKGNLTEYSTVYDIDQIHQFTGWCWDLMNFAVGVRFAMFFRGSSGYEPQSWPQRPPVPPKSKMPPRWT